MNQEPKPAPTKDDVKSAFAQIEAQRIVLLGAQKELAKKGNKIEFDNVTQIITQLNIATKHGASMNSAFQADKTPSVGAKRSFYTAMTKAVAAAKRYDRELALELVKNLNDVHQAIPIQNLNGAEDKKLTSAIETDLAALEKLKEKQQRGKKQLDGKLQPQPQPSADGKKDPKQVAQEIAEKLKHIHDTHKNYFGVFDPNDPKKANPNNKADIGRPKIKKQYDRALAAANAMVAKDGKIDANQVNEFHEAIGALRHELEALKKGGGEEVTVIRNGKKLKVKEYDYSHDPGFKNRMADRTKEVEKGLDEVESLTKKIPGLQAPRKDKDAKESSLPDFSYLRDAIAAALAPGQAPGNVLSYRVSRSPLDPKGHVPT